MVQVADNLIVCPRCAATRIQGLRCIAVERARDWQAERIRAEKLADACRRALGFGEQVPLTTVDRKLWDRTKAVLLEALGEG